MALAALGLLVPATSAEAADGTILRTITAQNYACSVGTGIAFDGTNLLLSCDYDNRITVINPTDGSYVESWTVPDMTAIGALAYDATRQALWACGGFGGDDTVVWLINPSTHSATQQITGTPGCPDGLAYDGVDDTLWLSPDVSSQVYHYSIATKALLSSYPANLGGCGNSGLAIGGPYLFLANNGCSQIYRADRATPTATSLFGTYPARLEDMECDDRTFLSSGKAAIWSKDAYDGILNAFELNPGDCGYGGLPYGSGSSGGQRRYVAMGDSFSAGEGNPAFQSDAAGDSAADGCHRSINDAYSQMLVGKVQGTSKDRYSFVACSGARVPNFLRGQNGEAAQIMALTRDTGLVTLSVGGNDVNFSDVLKHCIVGANLSTKYKSADCKNLHSPDWTGSLDDYENSLIDALSTDGTSLDLCETPSGYRGCEPSLRHLYGAIAASAASGVKIRVLLYPHLFRTDPGPRGCTLRGAAGLNFTGGTITISQANMLWINQGVDRLNAKISSEVAAAKAAGIDIAVADPRPLFDDTNAGNSPGGHGVCSAEPWIRGIVLQPSSNVLSPYSFHPNHDGQTAFAQAVSTAIAG